jgi:hypothetical protein
MKNKKKRQRSRVRGLLHATIMQNYKWQREKERERERERDGEGNKGVALVF